MRRLAISLIAVVPLLLAGVGPVAADTVYPPTGTYRETQAFNLTCETDTCDTYVYTRSWTYAIQYQDDYYYGYQNPGYANGTKKGYNGVIYGAEKVYPSVPSQLFGTMHKDGALFHGMTPDGRNPHLGDPRVNDMIEKIKLENDRSRQQDLVHDLIRYMTGQAYNIPRPATSKNFNVWWPVIGNLGVYPTYAGGQERIEPSWHWWIDSTKPPVAG